MNSMTILKGLSQKLKGISEEIEGELEQRSGHGVKGGLRKMKGKIDSTIADEKLQAEKEKPDRYPW